MLKIVIVAGQKVNHYKNTSIFVSPSRYFFWNDEKDAVVFLIGVPRPVLAFFRMTRFAPPREEEEGAAPANEVEEDPVAASIACSTEESRDGDCERDNEEEGEEGRSVHVAVVGGLEDPSDDPATWVGPVLAKCWGRLKGVRDDALLLKLGRNE